MEIRHAIHPSHVRQLDTQGLRSQFLVGPLFKPDDVVLTYTHIDRLVIGGAMPVDQALRLDHSLAGAFRAEYFLQRRELGAINVGGPGWALVDGVRYPISTEEALYVGRGSRDIEFGSDAAAHPAKFYVNSAIAHAAHPTRKVSVAQCVVRRREEADTGTSRTYQWYLIPEVLPTCQLLMGITRFERGSMWYQMPSHTHDRRMEVYLYYALPKDQIVVHLMGEPSQTRHLIVRNEEAVISPSWSIHSSVATSTYSVVWGMVGENMDFDERDVIPMGELY